MDERLPALPASVRLVDLRDRPADVPVLAGWLKAEFSPKRTHVTVQSIEARLRTEPVAGAALPRTWVAVAGDEPVGCARFVAADHADRPELTPWLASVYITETWRRQGIATALVATVQAHSLAAGYPALYLYTMDQARLYARLGFVAIGTVLHADDGRLSDLMVWNGDPR
ncbi:MAG: GNAT family N-acetyltransferase [Chloroflexi bacterium]|nr:GNAT family N-acetyltransferase [Chloroflexota bacterium]